MSGARPLRVLVLCAGNIGRSPLAAALLEQALAAELGVAEDDLVAGGVDVQSAGTSAPEGHGASERGIAFAAERGIDLTGHRAKRLTAELVRDADVIYGMDRTQIRGVGDLDLEAVAKTLLWEGEGSEIPDPHHESDDFFRQVGERVEAAVSDRVDEIMVMLRHRVGSSPGPGSSGRTATDSPLINGSARG